MDLFNSKKGFFKLPESKDYMYSYDSLSNLYKIKILNGQIIHSPEFLNKKISDRSLDYFLENNSFDWKLVNWSNFDKERLSKVKFRNICWQHDKIKMFGKELFLPRFSAWHGDDNKVYTYSGIKLQPKKWNKGLLYIKEKIQDVCQHKFNSVLLNWYRDGSDYINWHTDAEKELGRNPVIASVNFGATRRFLLRRKDNNKIKAEFHLTHGSLLIMQGETQHYWEHCVPKQKKINDTRINLTFRYII